MCAKKYTSLNKRMEQEFLEHVKETLEIDDRELNLDDNFRNYPEWSSLAFLSIIAMIDEEYDVIINGDTFKTLETLGDVLRAIIAAKG